MGRRSARSIVAAVACAVLVAGCAEAQDGDPATWELKDPAAVSASTTELVLLVSRTACSSGVTGKVLRPRVTYETERIVIQADVEPLAEGGYTCPGNPGVEVTVVLSEPVGNRDLVDGRCLLVPRLKALVCDDPVRRPRS